MPERILRKKGNTDVSVSRSHCWAEGERIIEVEVPKEG